MNKNSPVNRTVTALDAVLYALLMFGANFVSYYVGILSVNIIGKLVGLDGPVYDVAKAVPIIVLDMGVAFAVVLLADFLFFRGKMEKWTKVSFSSDALRVNFGVLVLPAEVLRFLLCMLFSGPGAIFGYRFFDGIFTFIPSFLHDQFYLTPHNRLESIRESGFSFGDNLTFFLYYLGYFLFTCVVLYFLFQYLWKQQERQQAHYEQNKLHMNSEQTKGVSLHRLVNEQNFCYEGQLNWEDRLKFGAVSIGVHFAAYFVSSFLFSLLLGMLPPIAQYPLLGILYTVLPLFWMGKYLSSAIPPMYFPDRRRCPLAEESGFSDAAGRDRAICAGDPALPTSPIRHGYGSSHRSPVRFAVHNPYGEIRVDHGERYSRGIGYRGISAYLLRLFRRL